MADRTIARLRALLSDGAGVSSLCVALAEYVQQQDTSADCARQAADLIIERLVLDAMQSRGEKQIDERLQAGAAATAGLYRCGASREDDAPSVILEIDWRGNRYRFVRLPEDNDDGSDALALEIRSYDALGFVVWKGVSGKGHESLVDHAILTLDRLLQEASNIASIATGAGLRLPRSAP